MKNFLQWLSESDTNPMAFAAAIIENPDDPVNDMQNRLNRLAGVRNLLVP